MIDLFTWPTVKAALDALDAAEAAWAKAKWAYRIAGPGQRTQKLTELQAANTRMVAARRDADRVMAEAGLP